MTHISANLSRIGVAEGRVEKLLRVGDHDLAGVELLLQPDAGHPVVDDHDTQPFPLLNQRLKALGRQVVVDLYEVVVVGLGKPNNGAGLLGRLARLALMLSMYA